MGKSEKINWPMVAIFIGIIMVQWQVNQGWLKDSMNLQEAKISKLEDKISELTGRFYVVSGYLAEQGLPPIYGEPQENEFDLNNINITVPKNGSEIDEIFSVEGWANVSDLDNIYVLSKINKKYWVLTDAIWDSTGKWKCLKSCRIPTFNESECGTFELIAIISEKRYGIGDVYDKIPDYIAKSNSTYVKKCS